MNIIIDPHMFELEDERDIRNNIPFFQTLILLCKSNSVRIFLYKELFEKMLAREVRPFPIRLGRIRDEGLLNTLKQLNDAFISAVMNSIYSLDIEACDGDQSFCINIDDPKDEEILLTDASYFELLSVLLIPCYDKSLDLSKEIVSGKIPNGIGMGKAFTLLCKCSVKSFEKEYRIEGIETFATDRDKAFIELENMATSNLIRFIESPKIERGNHHNKLQSNSDFDTYEGLSRVNKRVISLLRYFGLSKVIFGEFHEDPSKPQGAILAQNVQCTEQFDIVKGWLFAETGFRNHVDLYFPKNVGTCLKSYLDGEFDRISVERLKDTLAL